MNCKVEGCEKSVKEFGYCSMHYSRLHRHGDVNFRMRRANGEGGMRNASRMWFQKDGRKVQEAVIVVERVVGKKLPKGVIVHHVDENPLNCKNNNLVALQNQGMHNILHGRLKALQATGNAHAKPCKFCHKYELAGVLVKSGTSHYHKECNALYSKALRAHQSTVSP